MSNVTAYDTKSHYYYNNKYNSGNYNNYYHYHNSKYNNNDNYDYDYDSNHYHNDPKIYFGCERLEFFPIVSICIPGI